MLPSEVLIFIGSAKNFTNFTAKPLFSWENPLRKKLYNENKTIHPNRHITKNNLTFLNSLRLFVTTNLTWFLFRNLPIQQGICHSY